MTKQRHKSDCGIAAVANATGKSYATVKNVFGRIDRGGVQLHELEWLLSNFGTWKMVRPRAPKPVSQWIRKHQQGIFVVVLNGFLDFHAVAVVNGEIFGHYSDWDVVNYFKQP